ncbi:DHHC palmitoyltransferase-domain-containing protein [Baffinella frigidus]|nr:DHHC palmitoyltransferase-domain-containing protein [Cryptophyta sp. CCMP2293]|mmetsp:Transcript_39492/g.93562  ORF Transcript_39492/g.93562 Transcript_39492/m.93562 type:complete len:292 (+) Transcript_39492:37-912(+)
MSENEGKGCCDEESDFCVGVTLQLFLSAILAGTFGCFYWVILPGWVEQGSVAVVLAGTSFGLCFTLMVISYLRAWLTDPGSVPQGWRADEEGGEEQALHGEARFCRKCEQFKPPRASHCRQCGKCVLRMDHHCPWVQNCVGARNHKYFFLFLFWAFMSCLHYSLSVIVFVMHFFRGDSVRKIRDLGPWMGLLLGTEIVVFCLMLMIGGLGGWNAYLILKNQTTMENYDVSTKSRGKRKHRHIYDLGTYRNIQSLMGRSPLLWLLPLDPGNDPLKYEVWGKDEGGKEMMSPE